jgi:hypothetical protein
MKNLIAFILLFFLTIIVLSSLHRKAEPFTSGEAASRSSELELFEIKNSPIQGKGVFAKDNIAKGKIIVNDLFPHRPEGITMSRSMGAKLFNQSICHVGKFFNHCSMSANCDVIEVNGVHKMIATRNIKKGEEITANYNIINKKFPFIQKAFPHYTKC